jgi:hypothetical protein
MRFSLASVAGVFTVLTPLALWVLISNLVVVDLRLFSMRRFEPNGVNETVDINGVTTEMFVKRKPASSSMWMFSSNMSNGTRVITGATTHGVPLTLSKTSSTTTPSTKMYSTNRTSDHHGAALPRGKFFSCKQLKTKVWKLNRHWPNRLPQVEQAHSLCRGVNENIAILAKTSYSYAAVNRSDVFARQNPWLNNNQSLIRFLYSLLEFEQDRRRDRINAAHNSFFMPPCSNLLALPSNGGFPYNPPLRQPEADTSQIDPSSYIVTGPGLGVVSEVAADGPLAGHVLMSQSIKQIELSSEEQLLPLIAGVPSYIIIQSNNLSQMPVNHNSATFHVRLFGLTIVSGEVVAMGKGVYNATFVVQDTGDYVLEIFCSRVEEAVNGVSGYTNEGKGFILSAVIYRSEHPVRVAMPGRSDGQCAHAPGLYPLRAADTHNCTAYKPDSCSDSLAEGRWVYVNNGTCTSPASTSGEPVCILPSGQDLFDLEIMDPIGLNWGFVWVPYNNCCRLHLFNLAAIEACALQQTGRNDTSMTFNGDSIGREMLQNIQLIASNFKPQRAMPKLKENTYIGKIFSVDVGFTGPTRDNFVHVRQLSVPHLLFARSDRGPFSPAAQADWSTFFGVELDALAASCRHEGVRHCYIYLDPPMHRQVETELRLVDSTQQESMSATRHKIMVDHCLRSEALSRARGGGLAILDGYSIGRAHFWGAWDGIHYSDMGMHIDTNNLGWYGGVSSMITQVLLNHVCDAGSPTY